MTGGPNKEENGNNLFRGQRFQTHKQNSHGHICISCMIYYSIAGLLLLDPSLNDCWTCYWTYYWTKVTVHPIATLGIWGGRCRLRVGPPNKWPTLRISSKWLQQNYQHYVMSITKKHHICKNSEETHIKLNYLYAVELQQTSFHNFMRTKHNDIQPIDVQNQK